MKIYAKVNCGTKRQALTPPPSGQGTLAPEGVKDYTAKNPIPVQMGHKPVTRPDAQTGCAT